MELKKKATILLTEVSEFGILKWLEVKKRNLEKHAYRHPSNCWPNLEVCICGGDFKEPRGKHQL